MPPGLSGSPPSFSRRAYYNRPSCNHQPSLSLSASLRAFDIHIAADTNSLTHYSPPPLLNKANKCTLWLFFFLFTRCRRCCSVLREGRKEGSGGQVFPANGLKTEPRGNRGFWFWEPRLLRYWILVVFCRVENGWDWIWAGLC